jgi:hypothetical protein
VHDTMWTIGKLTGVGRVQSYLNNLQENYDSALKWSVVQRLSNDC